MNSWWSMSVCWLLTPMHTSWLSKHNQMKLQLLFREYQLQTIWISLHSYQLGSVTFIWCCWLNYNIQVTIRMTNIGLRVRWSHIATIYWCDYGLHVGSVYPRVWFHKAAALHEILMIQRSGSISIHFIESFHLYHHDTGGLPNL